MTPTAGGVSLMQRWHWFDTDFMNLSILNDNDITPAETQTFTYDAVGRLASATSTAYGTRAYTYDKVGNRLSEVRTLPATAAVTQSYTYPAASNRLTSVTQGATSVRAFTYDTAGNVTVDNRSGTAWNFTINKAGRPSSIKQGTTAKGDYTYDGRQRLATRIVSNTAGYNGTSHILHGYVGCPEPMNENAFEGGSPCDRVLAETDGTGPAGTKREYIWLSDMPVAVIDKSVTPNQTYMVHADHLNRPYFMTDAARAIVWKAIYEPFGAVYSTTGTAAQTYRFPGQWFQIETNLAYNWHRHYDASLGRYVSADPIGLAAGPSLYGYVGQAPIEGTDETGLQPPPGFIIPRTPAYRTPPRMPVQPFTFYNQTYNPRAPLPSQTFIGPPGARPELVERVCSALENVGGGRPIIDPNRPLGAPQFVFPNGGRIRFDIVPGTYGTTHPPYNGPHINIENFPGQKPSNIHVKLK